MHNIDHDIANQEALGTNPVAHNYVRLYFRPKTHFHLRTEGIKLRSDGYRLPAHMSIPIMFILDFAKIVTLPGVHFCNRKMAHVGIEPGDGDEYFSSIDFDKVYHDSGISDPFLRHEINDRRMAEVLVPDKLELAGVVKMILCRTTFEAQTLRHLVGNTDSDIVNCIRVATKPAETFFCWSSYITDLHFSGDALTLKIKTSHDYKRDDRVRIRIVQTTGRRNRLEWDYERSLTNAPILIRGWDRECLDDWRIEVEDALAFAGPIPSAHGALLGN